MKKQPAKSAPPQPSGAQRRRAYERKHNPIATELREQNRELLDRLHALLPDPLWVCGPESFSIEGDAIRRATDAEARQISIEDYGEAFPVNLYGDIPAQVVAGLQARIKQHQAAIRRIVAAGKRGELVATRLLRKAVK